MKLLFLIIIIFIFIFNEKKLIEPIIMSCCGGMIRNKDYHETDSEPPKKWERCFKLNEWNSFPCTDIKSDKCCGGKGKCRPSRIGGKCEIKNPPAGTEPNFYYNASGTEVPYTTEAEREEMDKYLKDPRNSDDDDDDDDDGGDLTYIFYYFCGIFVLFMGCLLIYNYIRNKSSGPKLSIFATSPDVPDVPDSPPSSSSPFNQSPFN